MPIQPALAFHSSPSQSSMVPPLQQLTLMLCFGHIKLRNSSLPSPRDISKSHVSTAQLRKCRKYETLYFPGQDFQRLGLAPETARDCNQRWLSPSVGAHCSVSAEFWRLAPQKVSHSDQRDWILHTLDTFTIAIGITDIRSSKLQPQSTSRHFLCRLGGSFRDKP